MTDSIDSRVTANESAAERRYSEALGEKSRDLKRRVNAQTQNTWTAAPDLELPLTDEFVGRVALSTPSADLGGARDFYIGTSYYNGGDYRVFAWTAPVACTFYRKVDNHHALCDDVAGVRVFAHSGGRIVDFEDERIGGVNVDDLFPQQVLEVPRAPVRRLGSPLAEVEETGSKGEASLPPVVEALVEGGVKSRQAGLPPGPPVRTVELLRRQLAAPKSAAMSAVLATLQSDQYESITQPASANQVLQGHPGTGKTVIAAHRVAYMLRPDAPDNDKPAGRVLILGPTVEYVEHVRGALSSLVDDPHRYEVRAIPSLLEELAELPESSQPTQSFVWEDASQELARHIDTAFSRAHAQLTDAGEKPTAADVYAELLWLLEDPPSGSLDSEWVKYLRDLPKSFGELKRRRIASYRGLMAYIGARTKRMPNPGHVIVDEAQDIHPIEWEVLARLGNRGGWTILGDLNQRRTDHSYASWDEVAQVLFIEGTDGKAPLQTLERGYRSTSQIIRFANQLLPARDRGLYSFQQNGELPSVIRAKSPGEVTDLALRTADVIRASVGAGSVAVIATNPAPIRAGLTKRGWKADFGDAFTWRQGHDILKLLPPERARGLEFDGVVVVEPADFPENVGRQGVLYTALTRANKLLAVVHQKPLPRGMKARA